MLTISEKISWSTWRSIFFDGKDTFVVLFKSTRWTFLTVAMLSKIFWNCEQRSSLLITWGKFCPCFWAVKSLAICWLVLRLIENHTRFLLGQQILLQVLKCPLWKYIVTGFLKRKMEILWLQKLLFFWKICCLKLSRDEIENFHKNCDEKKILRMFLPKNQRKFLCRLNMFCLNCRSASRQILIFCTFESFAEGIDSSFGS